MENYEFDDRYESIIIALLEFSAFQDSVAKIESDGSSINSSSTSLKLSIETLM